MTREEARAYFRDKGLAYEDITVTDLHYLSSLLNLHFAIQRKERLEAGRHGEDTRPVYWLRVNDAKRYKGQYDECGRLIFADITGKGAYFTARQVITFERNGFIGFCGDASDANAEPVLAAFVEWCDEMAAIKEIGERGDGESGNGEMD